MRRMIDMIRSSSLSASLVQAAARGALALPPAEIIEILVYLANHNKVFGQQARMTLAGWDEKASLAAAADPNTPREVLDYLIAPENLRPPLLPNLLENPSISDATLTQLAANGSREVVDVMRKSPRVLRTPSIAQAVASNANATEVEAAALQQVVVTLPEPAQEGPAGEPEAETAPDPQVEETVTAYLAEHAQEIAADQESPFQPLGGMYEFESAAVEVSALAIEDKAAEPAAATPAVAAAPAPAARAASTKATPLHKKTYLSHEEERGSALQKISKLDIKGRIQLAMKGTKEDRSILIRDSTKLVALAVLESPKITDGEVEKIANQKNVLEAVLRQIPMKRRFIKNYGIVRNLVANPRTPLDVSLGLMKNLLTADLRNLSSNKEVSDTIRKLATKMFKQKTNTAKSS
ncbi:MAG: hypothetical protein WA628_07310 [Terriglobales bacterium]